MSLPRLPYRVDPRDGSVVEDYTSNQISPSRFLAMLEEVLPSQQSREARWKAMRWVEQNPVVDHRWQGMYEDMEAAVPFANLQHWDVDEAILYFTNERRDFENGNQLAESLNGWIEDQFVMWGWDEVIHAKCPVPTVLEQYSCYWPMECHTARWIYSLLALHRATGSETWIKKAIAAGNSILAGQQPSGAYSTWGMDARFGRPLTTSDWPGANAMAVSGLLRLDESLRMGASDSKVSAALEMC